MSLEEKKNYILNHKLYKYFIEDYDIDIEDFDEVIDNIKDKNITTELVNVENDELTTTKFIILYKILIDNIDKIIFNVKKYNYIADILENKELLKDYFLNTDMNKDILYFKINRMIIYNFVNNAKYFSEIRLFLKDNDIEVKCIYNYSKDEVEKILSLITSIYTCISDKHKDIVVEHIDSLIEYMKTDINLYDNDNAYLNLDTINVLKKEYKELFEEYNSKKYYLKYFTNHY